MSMTQTTFELTLYGGAVDRRYRRLRPEVEDLPWATLRPEEAPRDVVDSARRTWTETLTSKVLKRRVFLIFLPA